MGVLDIQYLNSLFHGFLPCASYLTFANARLEKDKEVLSKYTQFVTMLCKTIPNGCPLQLVFDNFV